MSDQSNNNQQSSSENCPAGTELAGKSSACQGCPSQAVCASTDANASKIQLASDLADIQAKMHNVKNTFLVLSGKGGVGKSTFSTFLANYLSRDDNIVLIDADITGPSLQTMTGTFDEPVLLSNSGLQPVMVNDNLAVMSVAHLLPSEETPVIWRGPKKNGLIKQFLSELDWESMGQVDYLIFDTPPGTSDEHLSIVQYLKKVNITGAIIITTPQELALQDVRKEINFCKKVNIPILGVVENMAGFVCPNCTHKSDIFAANTGGAHEMCKQLDLRFLGSLPLDPRIAMACDSGIDFWDEFEDLDTAQVYKTVIDNLLSTAK